MKSIVKLGAAALLAVALPAAAHAAMLTASNGRTLYVFDKDKGMTSACTGFCALMWPPYLAHAGERAGSGWSIVKRGSGKLQWAYHHRLVYFYAGDHRPGDRKGDGLEGVWHVVRK